MKVGSASEQPREIVKRFYDGGARGEITSFRDSLAEDFELFVPPQLPWGGTFGKFHSGVGIHCVGVLPCSTKSTIAAGFVLGSLTLFLLANNAQRRGKFSINSRDPINSIYKP